MGRRRTPGLINRGGTWHIDKKIRGQRLCESTGEHDLQKAEEYLAKRIEETRKALIYGDRSGIDSELRERFNRAGVGHLLAISGLHVGIVAAVAFRCLLWIFSFCPPLLWRGWGRQWAAAATMLVVLGYRVLAGMIGSETANDVTIRQIDGTSVDVRREDIKSLKSLGMSFMPEGLEFTLDVPKMADLLAYLDSIQ